MDDEKHMDLNKFMVKWKQKRNNQKRDVLSKEWANKQEFNKINHK